MIDPNVESKELLLLFLLHLETTIGRYRLKRMLGLEKNEGMVRAMLERLRDEGRIISDRLGSTLTCEGKSYLDRISRKLGIVDAERLQFPVFGVGPERVGIHLRGNVDQQNKLLEIRDSGIRGGANGVLLVVCTRKGLQIPPIYDDLSKIDPVLSERLNGTYDLSEGDMLIIGFSNFPWKALEGALSATFEAVSRPPPRNSRIDDV